jgi:acetyl esterase/lipase
MLDAPIQRISYGADANQFIELWQPEDIVVGVAVMIHGGFWRAKYDLSHASPFCAALAAKGIATANLEYRRVGQAGGGWPGSFEDVIAGVAAASEQLGRAPVLIGHSAGGQLALRLASEPVSLRAVVALAPVADLRLAYKLNLSNGAVAEFLGATPDTSPDRYDEACPSKHGSAVPQVLVHGSQDEVVPIVISQAFVEARSKDPVPPTLIEIPNAKHMDLIDPESSATNKVIEIVLRSVAAN